MAKEKTETEAKLWGELRSLLSQPLDRNIFLKIWDLLDEDRVAGVSPDFLKRQIIPYARAVLDQQVIPLKEAWSAGDVNGSSGLNPYSPHPHSPNPYYFRDSPTDNFTRFDDPRAVLLNSIFCTLTESAIPATWLNDLFRSYAQAFQTPSSLEKLTFKLNIEDSSILWLDSLWSSVGLDPFFANLEEFTLTARTVEGRLSQLIPLLHHFPKLKSFTVRLNKLDPAMLREMLISMHEPLVHRRSGGGGGGELSLGQRKLSLEGECALEHLCLWGNEYGDSYCAVIAQSPWLKNLKSLDLGSTNVTARGLSFLGQAEHLQNLRDITLAYTPAEGQIAKPLFLHKSVLDILRDRGITWEG